MNFVSKLLLRKFETKNLNHQKQLFFLWDHLCIPICYHTKEKTLLLFDSLLISKKT